MLLGCLNWTDDTSILCIRACNAGLSTFARLLEMIAMFGGEIIGNLCSESRKRHF